MKENAPSAETFQTITELCLKLNVTLDGLTDSEAANRRSRDSTPKLRGPSAFSSFVSQFTNPIQLLLLVAALLSAGLHEVTDCLIIVFILLISGILSFVQEFRAGNAVAELLKLVETRATVIRDGKESEIPLTEVTAGDVAILTAGAVVPGDGLLIEADSLFVDQAALTGESFPVERSAETGANKVLAGTNVVSGQAKMLVAATGTATQLGGIANALRLKRPEGDFQRGIRQLGLMLIQLTAFLTLFVLLVNLMAHRPILESFMFSLALAVGLTPQLLPAIVSLNLSRGALAMSRDNVIVKRLASIENFGSMTVLCSDKTGTLTEGTVKVAQALDPAGKESGRVLELCEINALLESGYVNPIDEALRKSSPSDRVTGIEKLAELPYDFHRKRLSILIKRDSRSEIISKGALGSILDTCTLASSDDGPVPIASVRSDIEARFATVSSQGFRVLGVASRLVSGGNSLTADDEREMVFEGMLLLNDPLRQESKATIAKLADLGIELKMITGDNQRVAAFVGSSLGLAANLLTGPEMDGLTDEAFLVRAKTTAIFAEIEPRQKQRIIIALRRAGGVVGYIGDGVNDGPALHASDVSISVANAVDVAKEAADFVMLKPDLSVLIGAVREGRRTFSNTSKYIFMATSANFGNMFSLAGASLLIPFLPLLAKQVLLTNLLTDLPEMTIAGDNVDDEVLQSRQVWSIAFLRKFMLTFGLLSSLFDFLTFAVLMFRHSNPIEFRTAWFTESVISASLIVLVFRSRRWLGQSKPSMALLVTTLATCGAVLLIPIYPLAGAIGFSRLPFSVLGMMLGIVMLYVGSAEMTKHWFFRRFSAS